MWPAAGGLLTALAYAASNVLIRLGLKGSNALTGAVVTLIINVVILWSLSFIFVPFEVYRLSLVWIFIIDGFLTQAFGRLLKYMSIERLGAARAASILGSTPMFSLSIAVLLFGERLTPLILAGAAFIVIGIVLLSEEKGAQRSRLKDILFPLAAAFLFGFSPNLRKWGMEGLTYPLLGAAVTATTSLCTLLTTAQLIEPGKWFVLNVRSLKFYSLAALCTTVALPIYYSALQAGQVVVVGPLANTSGFFTILIAHIFLGGVETVTAKVWIGCLIVVMGAAAIIAQ